MKPRSRFQVINSGSLCSLAGRCDNPILPRSLLPSPHRLFKNSWSAFSAGAYTTTFYMMVDIVKACTPTLTRLGWIFHHDGMYARKWPLPLCVHSVEFLVKGNQGTRQLVLSWDSRIQHLLSRIFRIWNRSKIFFKLYFLKCILYCRNRTEPDSTDSGQETVGSQAGVQEGLFKRYL